MNAVQAKNRPSSPPVPLVSITRGWSPAWHNRWMSLSAQSDIVRTIQARSDAVAG
jgi:hypothetical protein